MELRSAFISNLKKFRKTKKLSQMKLAELCNTSTSYIGEIEIGKKFPSVEMIQKIATALNIAPYKLFMTEDDVNKVYITPELKKTLIESLQNSASIIVEHNLSLK